MVFSLQILFFVIAIPLGCWHQGRYLPQKKGGLSKLLLEQKEQEIEVALEKMVQKWCNKKISDWLLYKEEVERARQIFEEELRKFQHKLNQEEKAQPKSTSQESDGTYGNDRHSYRHNTTDDGSPEDKSIKEAIHLLGLLELSTIKPHDLLRGDPEAWQKIKCKYRQLILKYHPDKNPHLSASDCAAQVEKFRCLQEAYTEFVQKYKKQDVDQCTPSCPPEPPSGEESKKIQALDDLFSRLNA